ncbi:MAG: spore coat protein CotJB [Lachnospiraceae bacterium]|nr:spore coat protein CotJB [Lachnospiraceae bacterium]
MNREGTMYGNGRGLRGSTPQGRMTPEGRGMRTGNPQGRPMQESRGMTENYRRDMECDCAVSESTEDCGCRNTMDIPAGNRLQLLTYIDEVSFCAYDLMLYLDTHPEDERAIEYFGKYNGKRDRALEIYEEKYGPLNYGQTCRCNAGSVKWVTEPWPWEGGEC